MNPLVSVLMVAHNAGKYLAPAVASILNQSYPHLELVLVDNGSTDSSVQNLAPDTRIKLVAQTRNLLHAGGLNAGFPHCQGELIAIMDADDISLPERLEKQVRALQTNPSLDGVGCAARTIDSEGVVTGREFLISAPDEISIFARYDMPFNFPTLTARRSLLANQPFRTGLTAPDLDLLNRSTPAHRFLGLAEPLFHYRRHGTSVTTTRRANLFACSSVARLAGARRRAGAPENFEDLVSEKDSFLERSPDESAVFAHYAQRTLAEGFYDQAIWHARKLAQFGSRVRALALLVRILVASRRRSFVEQRFHWRLALLGTIKAHRLHPL